MASAVAHYAKEPAWDRPELLDARQQVIDLFIGQLGYTHLSELGLDPTAAQLTGHLREVCRTRIRPEDYLVVYLAGHGEILSDGGHVLLTADTDPDDIEDALPTTTLAAKMLRGTPVQRLLLLLDTCYSGQGGNEFTASVLAGMRRDWTLTEQSGLVVMSSAQPAERAEAGAFAALLRDCVGALSTAGQVPTVLTVGGLVEAMNQHPARPGFQQIGWSSIGLTGQIPDFLPNPRHRPGMTDIDLHLQQVSEWETHSERRKVEFRRRFLLRAMGGHGDEPGWWFTGRHAALTDIVTWLDTSSDAALVVTAGPGSGKTAILGLVSALAHPEYRRLVPLDALRLPPVAVPLIGGVDVTIYAGGLTHEQVLAGLAAAAQVTARTVGEFITQVDAQMAGGRRFTAIIDALDEAADPARLITQVLNPIIVAGAAIRLLLGTRRLLLDRLTASAAGTVIELDEPQYADRAALTAYTVRGLLEGTRSSPYMQTTPMQVRAVAEAIAAVADPSFLVARIVSTTLAGTEDIPDPTDAIWRASLPRLPDQAMRQDLDTRLGSDAQRARDLLRPLAYAEGQGIPWENIWAPLASRISGRAYTDEDLLWLRYHAGSYVVEAGEADRSAYRLYHQALAEHLRADTEIQGISVVAVQQAFVDILTRIPHAPDTTRDWTRAHPYALRHLATHAAAAGDIDPLITDGNYLVHADPDTLLPALHHAHTSEGQTIRTAYRASAALHRHEDLATRREILAIDATRCHVDAIRDALTTDMTWRPRWATGTLTSPALRIGLAGHSGSVNAVICADLDGIPVAITTGDGGEVFVWDMRTGTQRAALVGHTGSVNTVTYAEVDGVPIAITSSSNRLRQSGEVFVWDLRTATRRSVLVGHALAVNAMACTEVDGDPIVITAGGDLLRRRGELLVWDLRTGARRAILVGHTGSVNAVVCSRVDGVPIAITASGDRTGGRGDVFVWDLRTATSRGALAGHTWAVNALSCTEIDGVPVAVTGSGDRVRSRGEVFVWDLRTGTQTAVLTEHVGSVNAVTCAELDDLPVAVIGSGLRDDDGEVLAWDLRSGTQLAGLVGHTWAVNAVVCIEIDTVPVAVTVGGGGTGSGGEVLAWDLRTGTLRATLAGHTRAVNAVACTEIDGVPIAVTGSGTRFDSGGEALAWDLRAGVQQTSAVGHSRAVSAVMCTEIDTVPIAITISGSGDRIGRDGEVLVWELRTGTQRAALAGHASPVNAVGCTEIDGVPVAVTGGGYRFDNNGEVGSGEVLVWDLRTGTLRATLAGHMSPVNTLICTNIDGAPVAITGSSSGTGIHRSGKVLVWDLRTGTQRAAFLGQPANAVICTEVDGVPIVITYGNHGDVFVWDLRTGAQRNALGGHTGSVIAVACAEVDGTPIAITATEYGRISVWDLRTGAQRSALHGRNASVNALVCTEIDGVPVAITSSGSGNHILGHGEVLVWDLRTGAQRSALHPGGSVNALVCTEIDGVPVAITGGSNHTGTRGEVFIWDLRVSQLLRQIRLPYPVTGLAYEAAGLLVVIAAQEIIVFDQRTAFDRSAERSQGLESRHLGF